MNSILLLNIACTSSVQDTALETIESPSPFVFTCPIGEERPPLGEVIDTEITETSGIGQSRRNQQTIWLHNDSGDGPFLYAIKTDGSLQKKIELNTIAIDWEDMGIVQLPESPPYIYIGDIGDNDEIRTSIMIHKVVEPEILDEPIPTNTYTVSYPDRAHNAEALVVHPTTGVAYIITKDIEQTQIFALNEMTSTLEEVYQFSFLEQEMEGSPLVTGGDISPDGRILFLRTYTHIWAVPAHILDGESMEEACPMPSPSEEQGESISVLNDGLRYITISEGLNPTIHQFSYALDE